MNKAARRKYQREYQREYRRTPKARQRLIEYLHSERGREMMRRRDRKWRTSERGRVVRISVKRGRIV